MFRHIVFFKFRDQTVAPEAKRRLEAMRGSVASLEGLDVGLDCVHSERSWHMVLDTRFANRAGYVSYAEDPSHLAVLGWLKTVVAQSATVDYEA